MRAVSIVEEESAEDFLLGTPSPGEWLGVQLERLGLRRSTLFSDESSKLKWSKHIEQGRRHWYLAVIYHVPARQATVAYESYWPNLPEDYETMVVSGDKTFSAHELSDAVAALVQLEKAVALATPEELEHEASQLGFPVSRDQI